MTWNAERFKGASSALIFKLYHYPALPRSSVCTSEAHPNRGAAAVAGRYFPTDATNPSQDDGDQIGSFSIIPDFKVYSPAAGNYRLPILCDLRHSRR
jgi:hypothetical protein